MLPIHTVYMKTVLGLTILLALVGPASAVRLIAPQPQGTTQLVGAIDSWFADRFINNNPSDTQKAWMQEHYERIEAFSPHFDSRLSWFPDTWLYHNAFAVYPDDPIVSEHPEWIMKDRNGNWLYLPFNCSNGVCPQWAGDFSNPAFRSDRVNRIKKFFNRGYKGVFVDDADMEIWVGYGTGERGVSPIDSNTNQAMNQTDWRRYMTMLLEQIRAALPNAEIVHNSVWFAVRDYNNPFLNRQIKAADYIALERSVNSTGLVAGNGQWGVERFLGFVDLVHQLDRGVVLLDRGETTVEHEYGLAGYLLINRGTDLLGNNGNNRSLAPDRYYRGYDLKLGNALGGRYNRDGILRRDFQCGTVLLNQPGLPATTIDLDGTHTNMAGNTVTSVRLGSKTAAVLTKPCANNEPTPPPSEPMPSEPDIEPTPSASETVTRSFQEGINGYTGTRDTKLLENKPNENFGGAEILEADGQPSKMAALIKWNVSSIPEGSQIESATLTFKVFNRTRLVYGIYGIRKPWVENQASWLQYAAGSPWQQAGANGSSDRNTTALGQISNASNGQTYTVRLNTSGKALVQSWVNNPSSNNGMAIMNYGNWDGVDLYSSEAGNKSYSPKLTVTYR